MYREGDGRDLRMDCHVSSSDWVQERRSVETLC